MAKLPNRHNLADPRFQGFDPGRYLVEPAQADGGVGDGRPTPGSGRGRDRKKADE